MAVIQRSPVCWLHKNSLEHFSFWVGWFFFFFLLHCSFGHSELQWSWVGWDRGENPTVLSGRWYHYTESSAWQAVIHWTSVVVKANRQTDPVSRKARVFKHSENALKQCTYSACSGRGLRKLLNIDHCNRIVTTMLPHWCRWYKKSLQSFSSTRAITSNALKKSYLYSQRQKCFRGHKFLPFVLPCDDPNNTGKRMKPGDSEVPPLPLIVAKRLRGPHGFDDPVDELEEEDDDKHAVIATIRAINVVIRTHASLWAARFRGERIVHTFHWLFSFCCQAGNSFGVRSRGHGRFLRSENKLPSTQTKNHRKPARTWMAQICKDAGWNKHWRNRCQFTVPKSSAPFFSCSILLLSFLFSLSPLSTALT